jgi:hypothetical protein
MLSETTTIDESARPADDEARRLIGNRPRLVLLSFLMLFVELSVIRWSGANVVYLAYFSNLVLLGSFLGIGLGFLWAGRGGRSLFPYAPVVLAAFVAFIRLAPIDINVRGGQLIFFNEPSISGPPREIVLPVIFVTVAILLMFITDGVAQTFKKFEPLEAYKLDLVGSALGIVGVAVLSFLGMPPVAWGLVAGGILILVSLPKVRVVTVLAVVAVVVMLGIESGASDTWWSPYYKIERTDDPNGGYSVKVNEVPHQATLPVVDNPLYGSNYAQSTAEGDDVLIIGAGGGNDVAAALQNGAAHIDAVEIDRKLYELGKEGHPDRPYQNERVDVSIDDGRAYLERSDKEWDRILLALPDSLTLVTGQASVRLESYLFTTEAIESARDHLTEGGVFSMYNYYREAWLVDRYANTLSQVFGQAPCVETLSPGGEDDISHLAVLTVSEDPDAITCDGELQALWEAPADAPEPSSDNHPDARVLRGDHRPDPAGVAARHPGRRRAGEADDPLHRPVLHGRGVHAARDEERGAVRPAVRHDLVRERAGVPRRVAERAGRGAALATGHVQAPGAAVHPAAGGARDRVRGAAQRAARPRLRAAVLRGDHDRLPADLHGQPGVRPAVQVDQRVGDGVRRQPARRHVRRAARVRLADDRVPVAAVPGRDPLRRGVLHRAQPAHRGRRRRGCGGRGNGARRGPGRSGGRHDRRLTRSGASQCEIPR